MNVLKRVLCFPFSREILIKIGHKGVKNAVLKLLHFYLKIYFIQN